MTVQPEKEMLGKGDIIEMCKKLQRSQIPIQKTSPENHNLVRSSLTLANSTTKYSNYNRKKLSGSLDWPRSDAYELVLPFGIL